MVCKKCGAKLRKDRIYCDQCGTAVQLVPDYNLLDEDVLSHILKEESAGGEGRPSVKRPRSGQATPSGHSSKRKSQRGGQERPSGQTHRIHKKWIAAGTALFAAVLSVSSYFLYQGIQEKRFNSYDYQYQAAGEHFQNGENNKAISCYARAIELKPKDKKARRGLADVYLDRKDEKNAAAILEEVVALDPDDEASLRTLIEIYDKKKEYDKILSLREKADSEETKELFADYVVMQPEFDSAPGTYAKPLLLSISVPTGQEAYFTMDGKDPLLHGELYRSPISLSEEGTTEILAAAKNKKGICSETVSAKYTICFEVPDMPSVTPSGGTYDAPQMISIRVPLDCVAYYTWDGTDPTQSSAKYAGPLEMPEGNQVLSVLAVNSAGKKSGVYRVNYIYMPQ